MTLEDKCSRLKEIIRGMDRVIVGYSGGVDSAFLLKMAVDTLGKNVIAVLSNSATYPTREFESAVKFAESLGVEFMIINTYETDDLKFRENPPDRCYFCKTELYSKLQEIATEKGISYVLDGSNLDDTGDFRPGMKAVKEQKIFSPLVDAQFTKDDIRSMSRELGLPTWDKPALPCLSSRFPYGIGIDREKLSMVDRAENFLTACGFRNVRVRHHEHTAKIEVPEEDIERLLGNNLRKEVVRKLKELGYKYVTVDLQGFRSGSMNEVLSKAEKVQYINHE